MMTPTASTTSQGVQAQRRLDRRTSMGVLIFTLCSALLSWVGMTYDANMQKWLPETTPLPSTYNKKPSGTSGFLEIETEAGVPCSLWLLPYRQLLPKRGTLLVFSPAGSLKEFEVEQILRWVEAGNKIVYLDHFNYSLSRHLLEKLHLGIADGTALKNTSIAAPSNSELFSHVHSITISSDTRLTGGDPILSDKSGILVTRVKRGKGEIILGTVADLCANQRLTEKKQWDNFQFLTNLCRPATGELMIDERCHGYSKSSNVLVFLAKNAPGLVFAQLVLMILLAVFGSFHRFGKTREVANTRSLSSRDFIAGLSNVYRRAKANLLAGEIIGRAYRNRWCKTTGVSAHDTIDELHQKWSLLNGGNEQMQNWSQSASTLLSRVETQTNSNSSMNESELVHLAQGFESSDNRLGEIFAQSTASTALARKGTGK